MQHRTPSPRVLTDAAAVIADPAAYAARPHLAGLARLALMSARGTPLRQTGPAAGRVALRLVQGRLL
ncbi:hypothetical protein [Pseudoroseicyclus aestuarii]|uniref:Uncharacterized protein n=1 Tax=Pseudoroseicyclus aestuarii TaxID=1795041 RepID=A0A318SM08_9RHOB|nr:hypothetical protein [Pseudoroseicyclus aestuarii]PYE80833.1 hypothetical protein DFP88_11143 [Pseudoroseicyclus aestuarii]